MRILVRLHPSNSTKVVFVISIIFSVSLIPLCKCGLIKNHDPRNEEGSNSTRKEGYDFSQHAKNNHAKSQPTSNYSDYENITDGDLSEFSSCNTGNCSLICSGTKIAKCDKDNNKICLCPAFKFVSADINGTIRLVQKQEMSETACEKSCTIRSSYARILIKPDKKKQCICLTNQQSKTGITYCDRSAEIDVCKKICDSDHAICAFNGICLCRNNWPSFFNLSISNVRKEITSDNSECSKQCILYEHDFRARIYDPSMSKGGKDNKNYDFQSKYCLCGPEPDILTYNQTLTMAAAGFQICSGLKCKQRCGSKDAVCDEHRRACLCNRQNIFIGSHLWSRLPSHLEKFCQDACFNHQLTARVIEKNPLLVPSTERFSPWYRKSMFTYEYDGKFCHCVKVETEMTQFGPCTDEICKWLCGHLNALCDLESRRGCICNTHKLIGGLGRNSDPGEINCDIAVCRHNLMHAKVIDVIWDTNQTDGWGATKSKYCGCIRSTTPAGLTHCNGGDDDDCPKYCNNTDAYCTREKYCQCPMVHKHLLNNGTVRLPNGPELEECGEMCRSWMWPIAEDIDNMAFIYDEGRENCFMTNSCAPIDRSLWDPTTVGFHVEKRIQEEMETEQPRKFCICSKNFQTGTRVLSNLKPYKAPTDLECIGNHSCIAVGSSSIHIM